MRLFINHVYNPGDAEKLLKKTLLFTRSILNI